ncbi:MAG: phosphotransferase [Bacteroidales bacterium]|jgi:aminoglycoside/choline kinase family phosphotransferase|nr:phosphotransferase [Bacteroidales bacterium]
MSTEERIQSLLAQNQSLGSFVLCTQLSGAGSSRQYFRVHTTTGTYIACNGTNLDENRAFLYFARHFAQAKLPVPRVFASETPEPWLYMIEDCGDTDLLSYKQSLNEADCEKLYQRVLLDLQKFQIEGAKNLDYSRCFSRPQFDEVAMKWDFYYFKYYYLKLSPIECSDQQLENDCNTLISFLLQAPRRYCMYRDFQARNMLVHNNSLHYIDFQGAMQGALQYDVVSLLYQAKANLSPELRSRLLDFYVEHLPKSCYTSAQEFKKIYEGFVFIRILQTLGSYGYRGFIQRKQHFIESIPSALENLKHQSETINTLISIPYLNSCIQQLRELKTNN